MGSFTAESKPRIRLSRSTPMYQTIPANNSLRFHYFQQLPWNAVHSPYLLPALDVGIVRYGIQFSVHFVRTCGALMEVLLSTWQV